MFFSPAVWPEFFWCDASGSNTSELWLIVNGMVQILMGACTMAVNAVPALARVVAAWEPVMFEFETADLRWALPESFFADLEAADEVSIALRLQQQLMAGHA